MKNIVLTGFMGTGKTSVAKELSLRTGYMTVDIDAEIEKSSGMTINDIFAGHGEPHFRDMETSEIRKISNGRNLIISTGGGAVLRAENMAALRANGVIVCLWASPETILKRTSSNEERPLLKVDDPLGKIKELLDKRKPYYEKADIMIDTDGKTPAGIAGEILQKIRERGEEKA